MYQLFIFVAMAPKCCEILLTFNFGEQHFKKSGGLKYYWTAGIANITTVHCVTQNTSSRLLFWTCRFEGAIIVSSFTLFLALLRVIFNCYC